MKCILCSILFAILVKSIVSVRFNKIQKIADIESDVNKSLNYVDIASLYADVSATFIFFYFLLFTYYCLGLRTGKTATPHHSIVCLSKKKFIKMMTA